MFYRICNKKVGIKKGSISALESLQRFLKINFVTNINLVMEHNLN